MDENFERQHETVREENGVLYGDLLEYIDYPYLARVSGLNLAALANMALAPPPPQNTLFFGGSLDNFSQIRWSPPDTASDDVGGYFVLIRAFADSDWTTRRFVRECCEIVLPFSKDNYLFGVQTVSTGVNAHLLCILPIPIPISIPIPPPSNNVSLVCSFVCIPSVCAELFEKYVMTTVQK